MWTWDPPRFESPASAIRLRHSAAPLWTRAISLRQSRNAASHRCAQEYIREIAKVCQRLRDVALKSLEAGALPLVLGGDHSLAAGSVAASAESVRRSASLPLGLIWVDAHGDMNTPETTTSGNVHGMPLAALLGHEPAELASIGFSPSVQPQHTVLLGVRNLDDQEKERIRQSGVHVFTIKDIDRDGIARVAERALAVAADGTGGIHISLDMDVCDPSIAPGVGTAVKGGLNYREAHMVMELVADSRRLVARISSKSIRRSTSAT